MQMQSSWNQFENKRFEEALSSIAVDDRSTGWSFPEEPNWEAFHPALLPGKSSSDFKHHFDDLVKDVAKIEAGLISLPNYVEPSSSSSEDRVGSPTAKRNFSSTTRIKTAPEQERRKGLPWTEEEHNQFLLGLAKYGKGDWRSISRHFVITRTPTQVASHAQKYFIRLASQQKDRRRNSIHDITSARPPATNLGSVATSVDPGNLEANSRNSSSSNFHQFGRVNPSIQQQQQQQHHQIVHHQYDHQHAHQQQQQKLQMIHSRNGSTMFLPSPGSSASYLGHRFPMNGQSIHLQQQQIQKMHQERF